MKILSRQEAKALGLKRYFTGKACIKGHVAERFTANQTCLVCVGMQARAWRKANLGKAREHGRAYVKANLEKIRERKRAYYAANSEKILGRKRALYKANPEKARERSRTYRKANPEKARDSVRVWRKANPEKDSACSRAWLKANKPKVAAKSMRRHASKLHATPIWACRESIERIYAEAHQLTIDTGIPHHVDHIVPLKSPIVCGLHTHHNLRAIPAVENMSKGNRFND